MYAVVGCADCEALWVVADRPETTGCPRCGTRHRFDRLKRFVETEDEDAARQARAAMLAERSGHGEAFDELGTFRELSDRADAAVVSDEEYLAGSGLDVESVEAAGERASRGNATSGRSRRDVVRSAIAEQEGPTEDEVAAHAAEHGVPEAAARDLVSRLLRSGEATDDGGRLRLL